jgi:hypothetical protein
MEEGTEKAKNDKMTESLTNAIFTRSGYGTSVAERGLMGRTFSGRVRGLAVPGVNLLSNMI